MKQIAYLILILSSACSDSSSEEASNKIDDTIKYKKMELVNFTIHDKNQLLLSLKNNTSKDYYIKCYNVKHKEIPSIEAIIKRHNFVKNRWELPIAENVDTSILFKCNTEMHLLLVTKTESIDTLHVETYFEPVLPKLAKREKLIMHFVINQNKIRKYDDSSYIDRSMIDSVFAK